MTNTARNRRNLFNRSEWADNLFIGTLRRVAWHAGPYSSIRTRREFRKIGARFVTV